MNRPSSMRTTDFKQICKDTGRGIVFSTNGTGKIEYLHAK